LGFECAPGWQLGLVGAIFLTGIVFGCCFVTKMGDKYGRKPVYITGLAMNLILISSLIFFKNTVIAYIVLFLLGVSITARYYVGYTYNIEMQPESSQVVVSTVWFLSESVVYLLDISYFFFVSNYWVYL
jgi:MFS family permease